MSRLGWYMKKKEITLTEQEIGSAYAEALKIVSTSRAIVSEETRQCMADALHEFYDLLEARIESKRSEQARDPGPCVEGNGEGRHPAISRAARKNT
jgi:hypothetical protein